ncbi:MAG: PAS domain S-box protein, partial [Elusimicrobiota bacterium]
DHTQKTGQILPINKADMEKPTWEETQVKTSSKKKPSFIKNLFGTKKRQEEFEYEKQRLDNRQKQLDQLEAKLMNERKNLDKRIARIGSWKEKLVALESEIEKRRKYLVDQEKVLGEENISSPTKDVDQIDHEILDKIPQCAAIVQRGFFKQINDPFLELIGFETDEIVNKSLFDFVAPDGFEDIEQYYLNRLKGRGDTTYKTVFSAKNKRKIPVEISIKPTIYNGERAEIAIVNELKKQTPTDKE